MDPNKKHDAQRKLNELKKAETMQKALIALWEIYDGGLWQFMEPESATFRAWAKVVREEFPKERLPRTSREKKIMQATFDDLVRAVEGPIRYAKAHDKSHGITVDRLFDAKYSTKKLVKGGADRFIVEGKKPKTLRHPTRELDNLVKGGADRFIVEGKKPGRSAIRQEN